jgi:glycosyltransferase involved in cell wall biosynthesis
MRIGIYAQAPSANGGVFRYTLTFLEMLRALELDDEFAVLHRRRTDVPLRALVGGRWSSAILPSGVMDVVRELGVWVAGEQMARRVWYGVARLRPDSVVRRPLRQPVFDRRGAQWYRDQGLDLVLYPVYSVSAFETRVPAMVTVHDLNHRVYTEFPEVRALGEFERREYYFRNVCRSALTLLVESDTGREDLLNFYADTGLGQDRVVVLPMLPAHTVTPTVTEEDRARVRERYALGGDYLFYPAQFWPHKNHVRLIEALSHLKQTAQLTPTLVLVGSYSGSLRHRTFQTVMRTARRLGVDRQVCHLGFVPDEDMSALYRDAVGLVMPTFFGPTNIPVLEAFTVGCPVVTSDIRGIREQTDGAAILVDPQSSEAIADGLRRLLTSSEERSVLIRRGREVVSRYTARDYQRILKGALEDTKARLWEGRPTTTNAVPAR